MRPRPPEPRRGWIAEIEWRDSCFRVIARSRRGEGEVTVAGSPQLSWPPADAEAVQDLRRAAEGLEARLLAAGWTPLPPGRAWYAKRFEWAAATAAPAPATAPARAEPAPVKARFVRPVEWPAGSETLWRCEIKWHAGYVNSRFEAVAHAPKRRRRAVVAQSDVYKWLLMGDPGEGVAAYTKEITALAARLTAAGWEPAGRGRHWYELRFLWRREGPPPERLEPAPAETARRPGGVSRSA